MRKAPPNPQKKQAKKKEKKSLTSNQLCITHGQMTQKRQYVDLSCETD